MKNRMTKKMSDAVGNLSGQWLANSFADVQAMIDEEAKVARQRADDAQDTRDKGLERKIYTAKLITELRGYARGLEWAAMRLNDTVIKEPEGDTK